MYNDSVNVILCCLQLRKDSEDDKQRAVSRALAQAQRDADSARRQTEERCKEELADEMKKVVQKHKAEISATKKKQWVCSLQLCHVQVMCLVRRRGISTTYSSNIYNRSF